ncbi:MAG TPA: Ig-like domain-containing protein, partial [Longimicrobiaceae bacterium]|nr:Ig-like domain-containing protein [Longimicrobiaceae bacterium]
MLRLAKWALPALVLAGAAGCKDDPLGPGDMRMLASPEALSLYVGQAAPIMATVLRDDGRVVPTATVRYWSEHPSVAGVSADGTVTGLLPGSTHVVAAYGTVEARVAVTVARDDRGLLHELRFSLREVSADTRGPNPVHVAFTARNAYGNSVCQATQFAFRSDATVATAWNQSSGPESCLIAIQAQGWGETYVVASANGISDSVLVKVTSRGYQVYFSEFPTVPVLAGTDVRVTAAVVHRDGTPVPGQSVLFDVGAGELDSYRVVTDSAGKAAVTWTAPTRLRGVGGSRHTLHLLTQFPGGSMATASVVLTVFPGPAVRLQFYRLSTGTWQPLGATTTFLPYGFWNEIRVLGKVT